MRIRESLNSDFWHPVKTIYGKISNEDWTRSMSLVLADPVHWPNLLREGAQVIARYQHTEDIHTIHPWSAFWQKCQSLSNTVQSCTTAFYSETVKQHLPLWQVRRTGWTRVIPAYQNGTNTADQVENVAQHSYKTALLASALCPDNSIDAFVMGIIHDLAEIQVGDIPPAQVKDKAQKHAEERRVFRRLMADSECSAETAERLIALFDAYTYDNTDTAHIVHIADKLDMALQALFYEDIHHIDLQEFLDSAQNIIENSPAYAAIRTTWHV